MVRDLKGFPYLLEILETCDIRTMSLVQMCWTEYKNRHETKGWDKFPRTHLRNINLNRSNWLLSPAISFNVIYARNVSYNVSLGNICHFAYDPMTF